MDKKLILCLFLFCLGTFLTCYYGSIATFIGIFALLWANNISLYDQLKKGK
jgi:hypothetical protein